MLGAEIIDRGTLNGTTILHSRAKKEMPRKPLGERFIQDLRRHIQEMEAFLETLRELRLIQEIFHQVEMIGLALKSEDASLPQNWEARLRLYRQELPQLYASVCSSEHFEEDDAYDEAIGQIARLLRDFSLRPPPPSRADPKSN